MSQQTDVLDFGEFDCVVAPRGITRIRRKGGVLQQSTDGSAFADMPPSFVTTVPVFPGVDMALSINTAIELAALRGPGGIIEIGYGTGDLSTQIRFNAKAGITLRGQGRVATTLRINAAAAAITDGYIQVNDCYGIELSAFSVTASAPLTSARPDAIRLQGAGTTRQVNTGSPAGLSAYLVRDVEIVGCYNGVHVTDTTRGPFNVRIENADIQPCNGGSGIWIDSILGGMHYASDCQISTLVPAASTPALAAVRVSSTGDIELANINTYQCNYGLLCNPGNGQTINNLGVSGCVFDSNDLGNIKLACTGTGAILNGMFTGVWAAGVFTSSDGGHNVYAGAGCTSVVFSNCRAYYCSASVGFNFLADTGATGVHFVDCTAKSPAQNGFGLGGTSNACTVKGGHVLTGPSGAIHVIGVYINAGATNTGLGGVTIHATTPVSGAPTVAFGLNMAY